MEFRLELAQKQILSQHMVQSMEILQMSAQALEEYIENLSMENPVVELPERPVETKLDKQMDLQRKLDWLESGDQQNRVYYQQEKEDQQWREDWFDKNDSEEELKDFLIPQLYFTEHTPKEQKILEFMILSLDDRGYFKEEMSYVSKHFQVTEEEALALLSEIWKLDPAGVGARNLQECLLIQLTRRKEDMTEEAYDLVKKLISDYMEEIAKNHIHDIAKKLQTSMDDILDACEIIRSFNPKPGSSFSNREQLRYISPDVIVVKLEDTFEILINEYQYPQFSINSYYRDMLKKTKDTETKEYLRKKIQQAEWVQNCITQRSVTLLKVMRTLVEKQNAFFMYGTGNKVPMRLADIADELEVHESTVSRAMKGKYLQCSWGIFPLNYFLTSIAAKAKDTESEMTPEQVKIKLKQVIDEENKKKPYSDQAISDRLKELGVEISRRTVNKYRQEMGIPDKSGRKDYL